MKDRVAVFGRGAYFRFKKEKLEQQFEIIAFLDNNCSNNRNGDANKILFEDCPVYSPKEYISHSEMDEKIIIMTSQQYFISMAKQLIDYGVGEDRVLFGVNFEPYYVSAEKSLNSGNALVKIKNNQLVIQMGDDIYPFETLEEYKTIIRNRILNETEQVKSIIKMPLEPISTSFGSDYGSPVDRYYIEGFLNTNKKLIFGDVLEVADNTYTLQFSHDLISSRILHVQGGNGAIKGNLATGEGIEDDMVDCFICTQTLQMIYDLPRAIRNIYRLLKKRGTALITIHGISQISMGDYKKWGEYWRITPKTARELALDAGFLETNVEIYSYGNVKAAIGFLLGMCQEQFEEADLKYNDERFPIIIALRCTKE